VSAAAILPAPEPADASPVACEVEGGDLAAFLRLAKPVASARHSVPILGGVLFEVTPSSVRVSATDQEQTVSADLTGGGSAPGRLCVSFAALVKLCGKAKPGSVVSMQAIDGYNVAVRVGGASATLPGFDPIEFPVLPEPLAGATGAEIDAAALRAVLSSVSGAMCMDETRANLCAVSCERNPDGGAILTATDGHRLHTVTVPELPAHAIPEKGAVVPRDTVNLFSRLLSGKGDSPASLAFFAVAGSDAERVALRRGRTEITARLVEGEFPDYHQVVPTDREQIRVMIDPEAFRAAVDPLPASERTGGVKLTFGGGVLHLYASDGESTGEASIPCDYHGNPFAVGFNRRYLLEAFAACGGEAVSLAFAAGCYEPNKPDSAMPRGDDEPAPAPVPRAGLEPLLIEAETAPGWSAVVMPMRL